MYGSVHTEPLPEKTGQMRLRDFRHLVQFTYFGLLLLLGI